MKVQFKNSANYFLIAALFAMLILGNSCATRPPNLLEGCTSKQFESDRQGNITSHFDQAIVDDCNGFMKQENVSFLYGALQGLYEDDKGQYAVEFDAITNGKLYCWHYFLFYDKNGKRIKVIKYYLGRSSC